MKNKSIQTFIEPYNFFSLSPNSSLQDLLVILENKAPFCPPIIVKENNQLVGYLPINLIPKMVLYAQNLNKDFSSVLIETFFIPPPPTIQIDSDIHQALQLMKKYDTPILLVQNSQEKFIASLSIQDILKEL